MKIYHCKKNRASLLPPGEGQDEGILIKQLLYLPRPLASLSPTLSRRERELMGKQHLLAHKPVPDRGHRRTLLHQFIVISNTRLFLQGKVVNTTPDCTIGISQRLGIVTGHQSGL